MDKIENWSELLKKNVISDKTWNCYNIRLLPVNFISLFILQRSLDVINHDDIGVSN